MWRIFAAFHLTVSDKDGTITREYDALNRVTSVTDYNGDTISYAYDELGNRVSITYPGGEKVRYTYDKAGRMLTVTDAQGKVTYYTYDKNGRLIETKRPDGSRELCTYNVIGQLTVLRDETAAGEVINEYSYEYDGNGNIINITGMDTGFSEGVQNSIAALTDENPDDGITPAVENADGSITVAVSMTYDADNRLMTYNGQTVEYDAVGNMTRGPLNGAMADFTYDCRNRLVKVKEADGTTTEYEYDAENIRTAVISGGIKTVYTTDRESTYSQTLVKTEYKKNTWGQYTEFVSETTYTYGLGLIGERRDNNQEFYYHYNHIGSTMAVTDADGIIYYRFIYDTYGELSDITTDDGVSLKSSEQLTEYRLAELAHATGIDYLYNGQYGVETDANGLYYMRARYYNQDIKRFINRDVVSGDIGNSQSLNRYCYVQGNPVSLTDPFGLCPDGNADPLSVGLALMSLLTGNPIHNSGGRSDDSIWSIWGHTALDVLGIFWDGADLINAAWYALEGNWEMAIISGICALPFVGNIVGGTAGLAMKVLGRGMTFSLAAKGTFDAVGRAYEDYQNGTLGWHNALDIGLNGFALTGSGYMFQKGMGDALNGTITKGISGWLSDNVVPMNNKGFVDPKAIKALFSKSGSKADLGNKLDYQFGKAGGNKHNIDRTTGLKSEMDKLGFDDTPENRAYFEQYYNDVLNDSSNIVGKPEPASYVENGITYNYTVTTRESFLMGKYGGAKVTTHWDGNRLLTIKIGSGKQTRYHHQ